MHNDIIEELFQQHYNSALLYTLTLTHSAAEAEDIVGEAYFKALITVDDSITSFKAWLLAVCRNAYYDRVRKNKRLVALTEDLQDQKEALIETIIKEEGYAALHKAVSVLRANYREIVVLFYFEGMSVQQIAEITNSTQSNVKTNLFRARKQLKTILEEIS